MRTVFVVLMLMIIVLPLRALSAQAATDTPTPTPDTALYWILRPTQVNDLGTPEPDQDVALDYRANLGDVINAALIAAILFSLLGLGVLWLLMDRKE